MQFACYLDSSIETMLMVLTVIALASLCDSANTVELVCLWCQVCLRSCAHSVMLGRPCFPKWHHICTMPCPCMPAFDLLEQCTTQYRGMRVCLTAADAWKSFTDQVSEVFEPARPQETLKPAQEAPSSRLLSMHISCDCTYPYHDPHQRESKTKQNNTVCKSYCIV